MESESVHSAFSRQYHANKDEYDGLYSEASLSIPDDVAVEERQPQDICEEQSLPVLTNSVTLNHNKETVGIAFYNSSDGTLSILAQDIHASHSFEILKLLSIRLENVAKVYTSSRASKEFIDALKDAFEHAALDFLSPASFSLIQVYKVFGHCEDLVDKHVLWDSIDSESVSLGCAAAMAEFIPRPSQIAADLVMNSQMLITNETMLALRIFDQGNQMGYQANMEDISLFDLLDNTSSVPGKRLLSSLMRRPTTSIDDLNVRYDAIDLLLHNKHQWKALKGSLRGCKLLTVFLECGRMWVTQEWRAIFSFFNACNEIISIIHKISLESEGVPTCFEQLTECFNNDFVALTGEIYEIIDFEASIIENRTVVRYGIDEALDEFKKEYENLESILGRVASEIKVDQSVPDTLKASLKVVYFPQLGFLVFLEPDVFAKHQNDLNPDEWVIKFQTESGVYFKNYATMALDENIGDIYHVIVDKEIEILTAFQMELTEFTPSISILQDIIAEIDVYLSFSMVAEKHNYVRPRLDESTDLDIVEGRHPLLENGRTFIPNDTKISKEKPIVILTGPNASGKSVYLKQIALIVFMAQIGSFVPAKEARIGIVDALYSRISTRETVELEASSFLIDLRQIYLGIRYCTPKSLIILDEFGKGTLTSDGFGLLGGLIDYGASKENMRMVVSTHFYELINEDYLNHLAEKIQYRLMKVMKSQNSKDYVFLFKLMDGKNEESLGLHCADMAGIPKMILERARLLSDKFTKHEHVRIDIEYEDVVSKTITKFLNIKTDEELLELCEDLKD